MDMNRAYRLAKMEESQLKELAVNYEKKAIAFDRMHNLDLGFHYWLMLDVINAILSGKNELTENIFPNHPDNV